MDEKHNDDLQIVFTDGRTFPVRITYKDLYALERKGKYERELDDFWKVRDKGFEGDRSELLLINFLYVAYLCACEGDAMSFDEFIDGLHMADIGKHIALYVQLTSKKK